MPHKRDAFTSLKILSRERQGIDQLQAKEAEPEVEREALKVLVNILHGTAQAQNDFEGLDGLHLATLKIAAALDQDDVTVFLLFRILFLEIATNPDFSKKLAVDFSCLPLLVKAVRGLISRNASADPQKCMTLTEALKLAFAVLKIEEGSEGGAAHFAELLPLLVTLVKAGRNRPLSPFYMAQVEAVNVLVVAPPGTFSEFFQASQDEDFIQAVLSLAKSQLTVTDPSEIVEAMFPIVICLTKMAEENKWARRKLKAVILPPITDRSKRPEEGDSLKAHLVRLMTSSHMPLNAAAGNLLFTLCKRKAPKFTRHVGMANGAGVLGQMALFSQGGEIQDTESEEDVDQEDDDYNPVTGSRDPETAPVVLTEEEKEAEAERLAHLFDQLNRTGIIQVMSQDAAGNQVPFNPLQMLQQQQQQQQQRPNPPDEE